MTLPVILFVDCAPFMGGAQESLWLTFRELHSQGVNVGLAAVCPELLSRAQSLTSHVWKFESRHWHSSFWGFLQYLKDRHRFHAILSGIIKEFHPTVIHANTFRAGMLFWRETKYKSSYRLVVHLRDCTMPAFFARRLAGTAWLFLAVSEFIANQWRQLKLRGNIRVIPNPVVMPEAVTPPADDTCLVQVADFVQWKNHNCFLALIKLLHQRGLHIRGIIKGRARDNESQIYLSRLKSSMRRFKDLQGCITIDDRDTTADEAFRTASVVISVSRDEPWGRCVAEALSYGRQVVAYNYGDGVSEILKDCPAGFLTPPDILSSLANAVETALKRSQSQETFAAAQQAALQFSSKIIVEKLLELLEDESSSS